MDNLSSSDLKTILHSKRTNLYYLERCRVQVNGGRVEYVTDAGKQSLYWNIPIANTTCILLGNGTSITQAAMRELGKAGVLVGFCGGGGTPLYSAQELEVAVGWMLPHSEYRPTEYLQGWIRFWFEDRQRLTAAKRLQIVRLEQIRSVWAHHAAFADAGFTNRSEELIQLVDQNRRKVAEAGSTEELLLTEARLTRQLFRMAVNITRYGKFSRSKRGASTDLANRFLDHGNYLAYGLGAVATWVLGLPHGLAVLHGKTRRGGLVFDAADIIKDAIVLPHAFVAASKGLDENQFRQNCLHSFAELRSLDVIIDVLKDISRGPAN